MRDSVRFICIGDLHGALGTLHLVTDVLSEQEETCAAVLLTGDFATYQGGVGAAPARSEAALRQARKTLSPLAPTVLWVPGNHDPPTLSGAGAVDGTCTEVDGVRVAGIGGGGPMSFGFPYEWTDREISDRHVFPCDILLSHTPPYGTVGDLDQSRRHIGSRAINAYAERARARVVVCGHVHEAASVSSEPTYALINVGSLGPPWGKATFGVLEFSRDLSLLSVKRYAVGRSGTVPALIDELTVAAGGNWPEE